MSYGLVFGVGYYLWKTKQCPDARTILFWATIYHVVGVLGFPLFEDDYFRYLWDAYHTVHFETPYGVAPSFYFNLSDSSVSLTPKFEAILGQINYPDIPTVYGPVLQYSFLLGYFLAPGEVWPLQLIYSAVDLVLVVVLLKMANTTRARIGVLLYAWSPLVLKEVVLTAHPDGLAVCLLMLAVFCYQREAYKWTAMWLAMSVAAKVFAVLFIPFLLIPKSCFQRRFFQLDNVKPVLVNALVFGVVLICLYVPLLMTGKSDAVGLSAMAQNWEFNSALFGLLRLAFSPGESKLILFFGLLCFFAWYFRRYALEGSETCVRGDWIMGLFLVCAPVINAWYVLWLLPFAALHFNVTAWAASLLILMSYLVGLNLDGLFFDTFASGAEHLGPYDQPGWVRPVEFGLVLMVALLLFLRKKTAKMSG
ncbi:hypothetical protein GCM10022277_28120 [Litoribacillus peritrichatus]|uniref:DUF2029 domain-containing protein n=1 Tax=Litoribacillus peritrichatus TaxID=718191 RepID=A0ABP7MW14_9GAMM